MRGTHTVKSLFRMIIGISEARNFDLDNGGYENSNQTKR